MDQVSEVALVGSGSTLCSRQATCFSRRSLALRPTSQLKETKTARSGSDCPTLLHYLARLMGRIDPLLITFIDDLPHLEAAARGTRDF